QSSPATCAVPNIVTCKRSNAAGPARGEGRPTSPVHLRCGAVALRERPAGQPAQPVAPFGPKWFRKDTHSWRYASHWVVGSRARSSLPRYPRATLDERPALSTPPGSGVSARPQPNPAPAPPQPAPSPADGPATVMLPRIRGVDADATRVIPRIIDPDATRVIS